MKLCSLTITMYFNTTAKKKKEHFILIGIVSPMWGIDLTEQQDPHLCGPSVFAL